MQLDSQFFHHDAQGVFIPDFHAGIDFRRIGRRQNTLIEGIRGTGKTHILKMISSYHIEEFHDNRILPIYLSIAKMSEHSKKDPETFRLYLYTNLVKECLEITRKFQENLQPNKTLLTRSIDGIKMLFGLDTEKSAKEILQEITSLSESLWFELEYGKVGVHKNFGESKSLTNQFGANAKASLGLLNNTIDSSINEKEEKQLSENMQENIVFVGKQLSQNNAVDFLIGFLKQIQVILDLDHSLLLIDECSEAPKEAQIEIFRLLKAVRGAESLLPESGSSSVFFVASVYPRGNTYYPIQKEDGFNFEPGHDFTTFYLQWDITDKEGYESFFKEMLHNRAKRFLGYNLSPNDFIKSLFDRYDTFILAIYAAHGIPRRFWEILKRSYHHERITHNSLSSTIQAIAQEQLIDHNLLSNKDQSFIYTLSTKIFRKNNRIRKINTKESRNKPQNIFFEANRNISKYFSNLIMVGAVHDIKRMRTKTKQHGIPRPLFVLDITIVYALKSIPEALFIKFLKNELSRNVSTNFAEAFVARDEEYNKVAGDTKEPNDEEYLDDLDTDEAEVADSEEFYGTIKEYNSQMGIITPDDQESEAFFQKSNLDNSCSNNLSMGDRIIFYSHWQPDGSRAAYGIKKINTIHTDGIVSNIYKNIFGNITLLEDGTDAFFLAKDVDDLDNIEIGSLVEFSLEETETNKRKAYNIRLKEDTAKYAEIPRDEIIVYIYSVIDNSDESVSLADLGNRIINKYGDMVRLSHWFGYKKFMNFLESLELKDVYIDKSFGSGYISYKEIEHNSIEEEQRSEFIQYSPEEQLILKLSNEIGIPKLTQQEYKKVFILLKKLIDEEGYIFNHTAKQLRDIAKENNIRLNRVGSNFILRGIAYAGHWFEQPEDSKKLQYAFYKNILKLIGQNGTLLDKEDLEVLKKIFETEEEVKQKLLRKIRIVKKVDKG